MTVGKHQTVVEGAAGATPIHVEIDYIDHATTHHSGGGDQVDHDLLFNYVANEHIDWTVTGAEDVHADRIAAGAITQHEGSIDHDNLLNTHNLTTDIDHDLILNYVGNEHVDHSGVTITGTKSVSSGGDITTSRTLELVNDLTSPGNEQVYGTDGVGVRGWRSFPIANAFKFITDGTTTATASGPDTFKLRSANSKLTIVVTNDDATHGDNALFTIDEANIDHDNLNNYVAAEHVDWASTGAEDIHDDRIVASSITQHEGSIDHDALLNYVVGQHRIINDGGASTIELWSASKISSEISAISSGVFIKAGVATSTTGLGDITLSGEQTLNGVTTSTSRVIVTEQTAAEDNGIYVTAAGAWSRASDADEDNEVLNGNVVHVVDNNSTKFAYKYLLVTADPITVGATGQTWEEHKDIDFGTTSGTAAEGNDSRIPTQDENDALVGTNGSPSSSNKYVTNSDPRNTDARTPTAHASSHEQSGSDEIDGDKLDIDWNPTYYTPDNTPAEVTSVDHLTAHLKGIDDELGTVDTGSVSQIINPGDWALDSGSKYYYDWNHGLGTQELVFQARNHTTNEVIRVWDWDVIDDNNVRVYIFGNSHTIRAVAVTGRGPQGAQGPQGPAGGGLTDVVDDLTPQLGGDIDLNGFDIEFKIPTVDGASSGFKVAGTVDTNGTGVGAALYMASDGNFDEADASAASTGPCRALALETGTGSKKVLLKGFLRVDAWGWAPGDDIWLSTTTGALTQTRPSGDGDQVQKLGFAWDADTIYFAPGDYTVIEIDD